MSNTEAPTPISARKNTRKERAYNLLFGVIAIEVLLVVSFIGALPSTAPGWLLLLTVGPLLLVATQFVGDWLFGPDSTHSAPRTEISLGRIGCLLVRMLVLLAIYGVAYLILRWPIQAILKRW